MGLLKIRRKSEEDGRRDLHDETPVSFPVLDAKEFGISDDAALRINELLAHSDDKDSYLRVAIRGGGCSGLSLHYEFVKDLRVNDVIFTHKQARVVVDQKSLNILGGATLHCRDNFGAKEFILVNNPAEKQCSCGKSFAL